MRLPKIADDDGDLDDGFDDTDPDVDLEDIEDEGPREPDPDAAAYDEFMEPFRAQLLAVVEAIRAARKRFPNWRGDLNNAIREVKDGDETLRMIGLCMRDPNWQEDD